MTNDTPFEIPSQYRSQVRQVESKDPRSDSEILASLAEHQPITSEKNIWAFWHSGLKGLPNWCKRNLVGWHRLNGPEWTIRLLDTVPDSPNNALKWIDEGQLPRSFIGGKMDGPHVGPHKADLLRAPTLYTYGGVWMDVGCILIRDLDRICWNALSSDTREEEMCCAWVDGPTICNHFVAARKGAEFLKHWQTLFLHLWSHKTSSLGLASHPLIAFRAKVHRTEAVQRYKFNFSVDMSQIMEYTLQISAFARVAVLEEPNGGFNGREYWQKKILKFDCLDECWAAEAEVGFDGEDLFNVLATKRIGDGARPESGEYKAAERVVWRLLTRASMQKVTHGKDMVKGLALGSLWDLPENEGKDIESGTFAELLRYGSVNLEQMRDEIEYVDSGKTDTGFVLRCGLLEEESTGEQNEGDNLAWLGVKD